MDILYISPQSINEITRYCKKELVISVINHFAQKGKIILRLMLILDKNNKNIDKNN